MGELETVQVGRPGKWLRQIRVLRRRMRAQFPGGGQWKRTCLVTLYRGVNDWLAGLDVDYWLCFGTLLGQQREGDLIPWDNDVDFGLREASYQRVRQTACRLPKGFRCFDTSTFHHGPKLYVDYRGWEADLYFYRDEGEQVCLLENSPFAPERLPVPRRLILPTRVARFLDRETRLPADPEGWLRHNYGYLGKDAVRNQRTGYYEPAKSGGSRS